MSICTKRHQISYLKFKSHFSTNKKITNLGSLIQNFFSGTFIHLITIIYPCSYAFSSIVWYFIGGHWSLVFLKITDKSCFYMGFSFSKFVSKIYLLLWFTILSRVKGFIWFMSLMAAFLKSLIKFCIFGLEVV